MRTVVTVVAAAWLTAALMVAYAWSRIRAHIRNRCACLRHDLAAHHADSVDDGWTVHTHHTCYPHREGI